MSARWNEGLTYLQGGVIYAVLEIREYRKANPESTFEHAADVRAGISASIPRSDYLVAVTLLGRDAFLGASECTDRRSVAREILEHIIKTEMPPWATMIPYGRRPLLNKTKKHESNVYQCFDYAELFGGDRETLNWWNQMKHFIRDLWQQKNDEVGFTAEQMTVDYETARLASEGRPDLLPLWESPEDERLGYDVESWDVTETEPRKTFIETKGCRRPPLAFHLSLNQLNVARAKRKSWMLYLWDISNPDKPHVITYDDLAPHIPENRGSGEWKDSQISWPPKKISVLQDVTNI